MDLKCLPCQCFQYTISCESLNGYLLALLVCFSWFGSYVILFPIVDVEINLECMCQVKVFVQPHYLHNFVQSTFNALGAENVRGICLMIYYLFISFDEIVDIL